MIKKLVTVIIICLIITDVKAQNRSCEIPISTMISLFDVELSKTDIEKKLHCFSYKGIKGMAEFRVFQVFYQKRDSNYYDKLEIPLSKSNPKKYHITFETSNYQAYTSSRERFLKFGFELIKSVEIASVYRYQNLEIQTMAIHEMGRYIIVLRKGNKGDIQDYRHLRKPQVYLRKSDQYNIELKEKEK